MCLYLCVYIPWYAKGLSLVDSEAPSYDVFISYADSDEAWVHGYLIPALALSTITRAKFRPGVPVITELEQAVLQSRCTVIVFSSAYLVDEWLQLSDILAAHTDVAGRLGRLIPIRRQWVDVPLHIKLRIDLNFTEENREHWDREVERLSVHFGAVPAPSETIPCPYPGMVPFNSSQASSFYGRNTEINELLQRLRNQRYLFVIGPSGSGKSSLINAGLLSRLRSSSLFAPDIWLICHMRPTHNPQQALAICLESTTRDWTAAVTGILSTHVPAQRLLLVIDQFEEVFASAVSDSRHVLFIALDQLKKDERVTLILVMRADFYADLMDSPLWPVKDVERFEITPLRDQALKQAIEQPTLDIGVYFDAALSERLLADATDEPGVLPLLQETLQLLWDKRKYRYLSRAAYDQLGKNGQSGLSVAIATKADAVLAHLTTEQQRIARRIFLRLIQFGEGRPDTRRQQPIDKLGAKEGNSSLFDVTLDQLIDGRLLTTSGQEDAIDRRVDIAHEALITGWPTLRRWVVEQRATEQARRRLEAHVEEWNRLGQRNGGLLDATELPEAWRWLESDDAIEVGITDEMRAYVQISQHVLEAAARRERLQQRLTAFIATVALVSAVIAIIFAMQSSRNANQAEINAATAVAAQQTAESQQRIAEEQQQLAEEQQRVAKEQQRVAEQRARIARAGTLAAQSQSAFRTGKRQQALLLAVAATRTTYEGDPSIVAVEEALRTALVGLNGYGLSGHQDIVSTLALSPDGRRLVSGSNDGTVLVWDLGTANPYNTVRTLRGHSGAVTVLMLASDGQRLVTGGTDDKAIVWNLADPDPSMTAIQLVGHQKGLSVTSIALSTDGQILATGSRDTTIRVYNLLDPDPNTTVRVLRGHEDAISTLSMSLDGQILVSGSSDTTARVWNLGMVDPNMAVRVLGGHTRQINSVAIHPDGHTVVTGSSDGTARIWDLNTADPNHAVQTLTGHQGPIYALAISVDGQTLVTGSWDDSTTKGDDTARVWDLSDPDPGASVRVLRNITNGVRSLALSADGRTLVTGSTNGYGRVWNLSDPDPNTTVQYLIGHEGTVTAVAVSANGQRVITASVDTTIRIWSRSVFNSNANTLVLAGYDDSISVVALSANQRTFASGSNDGTVRVWKLDKADPVAASWILRGHTGQIQALELSADGRILVTNSDDLTIRVWDLSAPDPNTAVRVFETRSPRVALSADGRVMVDDSVDVRVFDVSNGNVNAPSKVIDTRIATIALALSADGRIVANAASTGEVLVLDLTAVDPAATARTLVSQTKAIAGIMLSDDGQTLVAGLYNGTVQLWDLSAPDPSTTLRTLRGHEYSVEAFALSADGAMLATGSGDGTTRVWSLKDADPNTTSVVLRVPGETVAPLQWSTDGKSLMTVSSTGTVRSWPLNANVQLDQACHAAGRNFSLAEWQQYFGEEPYRLICPKNPSGVGVANPTQAATPTPYLYNRN